MKYTLSQLLKDKKLRAALVKETMIFEDGNGEFELDFATQSLRGKCQRIVFDKLYALGGEKLFKKLLKEENTNLTRDPNASNAGMVSVAGAEGWYLKTNVGDPSALASILFGIAGWAEMSGDFDSELVSICDSAEAAEMAEEPAAKTAEVPQEEPAGKQKAAGWRDAYSGRVLGEGLPAADYSLATKNGKAVFYDDQAQRFVSFTVQQENGTLVIEEMLVCKELRNQYDDLIGYKYLLEEDGKWGYISWNFTQVLAPQFDDLCFAVGEEGCVETLLAWTTEDGIWMNGLWYAVWAQNEQYKNSYWLVRTAFEKADVWTEYPNDASKPYFTRYLLPEQSGVKEQFLYRDDYEGTDACFWTEQDVCCERFQRLTCGEGYMSVWVPGGNQSWSIPADQTMDWDLCAWAAEKNWMQDVTLESCLRTPGRREETGVYIVRRDGYYAVAELKCCTDTPLVNLLTPFAFTKIESDLFGGQVTVDRFGKKGVFDYERQEYVVPCEYEYVQATNINVHGYIVKKAGFEGKIKVDGTWETMLHR